MFSPLGGVGAAEISSEPLSPPGGGAATLFETVPAAASGVDLVNPIDKQHPTKRLYLGAFACGGGRSVTSTAMARLICS